MQEKKGNTFLKGAAVLGVAGLIVKIMGMFFRLPLTNWIGSEGMSYYSSVYPIYTFFLLISTAGIPVAISRMVSERIAVKNYAGAHKVFRVSVWLLGGIGLASFMIVFFGAGFIESVVLDNIGTKYALQAIAPSLLLVPVMSAYRGYTQGMQNMNPTAISQFFEQFIRVVCGLALAHYLLKTGYEAVCAGAIFGGTAGAGAGLLVVVLIFMANYKGIRRRIENNRDSAYLEPSKDIIKQILIIAVPITIGGCIMPLANAVDSMTVMRILHFTGWSDVEARMLWGRLGGYCSSLIGMPQVLIQAIVMSLVPAIAAGYKVNNHKEVIDNMKFSLRAAMIVGFPCTVGLFTLAKPILMLLYPGRLEETTAAAPTLMVFSISIIFLSIMVTVTGQLQGINKQMVPVKNLAIGVAVKIVVTCVLVAIHPINVNGAPIGTIACYITASVLDIRALKKYMDIKFDNMLTYVKPGICSVAMGIATFAGYKLVYLVLKSNSIATLFAILVAVVVYAIAILATKTISQEELSKLPKGDKLARIAARFSK